MLNQLNHATIFACSHPNTVKRTSSVSLLFSGATVLAGISAFILTFQLSDKSSATCMGLMVLGTALFLLGTFGLVWKSKELVYVPTNSVTKEHTLLFNIKYQDQLTNLLNSGSFPHDLSIRSEAGGTVRMDLIVSKDQKFAAVQLFQFTDYTYHPLTGICYFADCEAESVASFWSKSKR